ncbi:MAG: hypothetical protein ACOC3V_05550, partial [bacterium]
MGRIMKIGGSIANFGGGGSIGNLPASLIKIQNINGGLVSGLSGLNWNNTSDHLQISYAQNDILNIYKLNGDNLELIDASLFVSSGFLGSHLLNNRLVYTSNTGKT